MKIKIFITLFTAKQSINHNMKLRSGSITNASKEEKILGTEPPKTQKEFCKITSIYISKVNETYSLDATKETFMQNVANMSVLFDYINKTPIELVSSHFEFMIMMPNKCTSWIMELSNVQYYYQDHLSEEECSLIEACKAKISKTEKIFKNEFYGSVKHE